MSIRQEKRDYAVVPEVRETEYGATYVKAATEQVVASDETEPVAAEEPKRKGGRPKKSRK